MVGYPDHAQRNRLRENGISDRVWDKRWDADGITADGLSAAV
jgi:hypothetical protein